MNQLTIRGLDEALQEKLKTLAQENSISLNKAALLLMREGAGLNKKMPDRVGNSLDWLIGTWSDEEAREFAESQRVFEKIDEDMWE